jgi:DNA-binding protein H-NS
MARSYAQLQQQIQKLQIEAEKLRHAETQGVIDRIKTAIDHYGLTSDHLFGAAPKVRAAKASNGAAKYSDGQGRTWSGKGKRPNWLREAIASGRSLDDFTAAAPARQSANGAMPAKPEKPAKSRKLKKRATRVIFRDSAGNTWSGMGPRPRWLKAAIASGQSEESLRV